MSFPRYGGIRVSKKGAISHRLSGRFWAGRIVILRRLKAHFETENWFAVSVDFVIVVVGVYIGVLLGNWNSVEQDRQLYEQSFERMIAELQENIQSLEDMHEALRTPIVTVQLALDDLRACRSGDEARANVQAAFGPLGLTNRFTLNTVSIDQLIENEDFLRFQSPELRRQLLGLSATLHRAEEGSLYVSQGVNKLSADTGLTQKGPLVYADTDAVIEAISNGQTRTPELVRPTQLIAPLSTACRDRDFLNYFYEWEDNAYYQSIFSELLAKRLRGELETLGYPLKNRDAGAGGVSDAGKG